MYPSCVLRALEPWHASTYLEVCTKPIAATPLRTLLLQYYYTHPSHITPQSAVATAAQPSDCADGLGKQVASPRSLQHALHQAAELVVVAPDQDARDDARVLVARAGALGDEAREGVVGAREHDVGGRQAERRAQVVRAVAAVDHALVGLRAPQRLQLLALWQRADGKCLIGL